MPIQRRQMLRLLGAALVPGMDAARAQTQTYPERPLHLIVPFPAGGTVDLVARLIGRWLGERLGQPVVVENKPGGGTNIAVQAAVSAPADGYTLLVILATNTINPWLYKSLPFDFRRDIAPVAGLAELPLVMEVNPRLPVASVKELIAYAKTNPGKINFGSFGAHTISDLTIELFSMTTGVDVVRVPYPGGATLVTDLLSDRVQAAVDALPNSLSHIRNGSVRALAMLSRTRSAALPDVPAIGEAIAGFEVSAWTGIGVPRATPGPIVERLNREINAGLADPGIKARLVEVGGTPLFFTPGELRSLISRETEKWADVVKHAGIEAE